MANKTLPKVQLTPEFRTYLEGNGPPPDAFAEYFAEWVVLTPREKLADPYPDGHLKLPHLWPVKLLHSGRGDLTH